jgi:hypothetical protein
MRAERPSSPMIKPLISDWGLILAKVIGRK